MYAEPRTFEMIEDKIWMLCKEFGEENVFKILVDVIRFRRGEEFLNEIMKGGYGVWMQL